jgi:chromate transporter
MGGVGLLLQIAERIAGLACIAVGGGNALIPALHEQTVVSLHWLSDARFTETVALSQAAPGPNMLVIPLIGAQTAGIPGALVALAAFLIPSASIAVLGARALVRYGSTPAVAAFRWALRPVTAGLMLSAAVVLIRTAAHTWPPSGSHPWVALTALAIVVAGLALRWSVNPLIWLAAAALAGALLPSFSA